MKIIAVVKFNDSEAFVLSESPKLEYTKHGSETIIGTDGTFYETYGYERPSKYAEAFGGRKFTLDLADGTKEACYGQWWSKVTEKASEVIGLTKENPMVYATANSIDSLKKCYVFIGYTTTREKWVELRKSYTGKVYEYREYEAVLKGDNI